MSLSSDMLSHMYIVELSYFIVENRSMRVRIYMRAKHLKPQWLFDNVDLLPLLCHIHTL